MIKEEFFKDVIGYEGIYQVSNLGNVKSLRFNKEKILKPSNNGKGYLQVILRINNKNKAKTLHILVSETFLNHKSNGKHNIVIDHINGDRLDNRLENLQLISQRLNTSKDKQNKTSQYTGVCWNRFNNKWMSSIRINGEKKHLGYFINELEASNTYQNRLKEII